MQVSHSSRDSIIIPAFEMPSLSPSPFKPKLNQCIVFTRAESKQFNSKNTFKSLVGEERLHYN